MRLAVLTLLLTTGFAVHAQDGPSSDKKASFHCPVVGLPDAPLSCCPGGYCRRQANARIVVDYKGAKIQLCCSKCIKLFNDAPAKFAVAANHQLVATQQAKQVRCPLTGTEINSAHSVEIAGQRIFLATAEGQKKLASATPFVRSQLVFGEQGFARGFAMTVPSKATD